MSNMLGTVGRQYVFPDQIETSFLSKIAVASLITFLSLPDVHRLCSIWRKTKLSFQTLLRRRQTLVDWGRRTLIVLLLYVFLSYYFCRFRYSFAVC